MGCHSSEAEKFHDFLLTFGQFSLTSNYLGGWCKTLKTTHQNYYSCERHSNRSFFMMLFRQKIKFPNFSLTFTNFQDFSWPFTKINSLTFPWPWKIFVFPWPWQPCNLAINTTKWWKLRNWKGQKQCTDSSDYTISQLNS